MRIQQSLSIYPILNNRKHILKMIKLNKIEENKILDLW